MAGGCSGAARLHAESHPWWPAVATGAVIAASAIEPAPLLPIARAYEALCARYPILALVTQHAPPLPLALLIGLAGCALLAGGWRGVSGLLATRRFTGRLHPDGAPLPDRVARIASDLGVAARMTYVSWAEPTAFCYGFVRPRIAVTAGLIERLDDEELVAVLGHERAHLLRRDPLRYLMLDALTAAAFMFPVMPTLRQRWTAQTELAADRAALAVASRGALAGALLAVIGPSHAIPGIAALTATEARITQLAGGWALPPIPGRAMAASVAFAAVVALAMADLAASTTLVQAMCPFCPWRQ